MNRYTTETFIASVTLTKKLPNRYSFSATAQLVHLDGNARPYFSVTGEERNLRRIPENQVEACGAMHNRIVKHFPELTSLVALHLSDDDGTPMHAVANGVYWLGLNTLLPRNLINFARLWRMPVDHAWTINDAVRMHHTPTEHVATLATAQAPRWAREAAEGLALIRKLAAENA
jgi:hypothetical protein